jgi:hypothetical protein
VTVVVVVGVARCRSWCSSYFDFIVYGWPDQDPSVNPDTNFHLCALPYTVCIQIPPSATAMTMTTANDRTSEELWLAQATGYNGWPSCSLANLDSSAWGCVNDTYNYYNSFSFDITLDPYPNKASCTAVGGTWHVPATVRGCCNRVTLSELSNLFVCLFVSRRKRRARLRRDVWIASLTSRRRRTPASARNVPAHRCSSTAGRTCAVSCTSASVEKRQWISDGGRSCAGPMVSSRLETVHVDTAAVRCVAECLSCVLLDLSVLRC